MLKDRHYKFNGDKNETLNGSLQKRMYNTTKQFFAKFYGICPKVPAPLWKYFLLLFIESSNWL
jgi:hypothetical protein